MVYFYKIPRNQSRGIPFIECIYNFLRILSHFQSYQNQLKLAEENNLTLIIAI